MLRTIIEEIYYAHYADEHDGDNVKYYYEKLYEDIALFAHPKHKVNDVENHFYGIICGLCRESELQAFKRGLQFALKLSAECAAPPPAELSELEAKNRYEKIYKEQAEVAERMKASKSAT